LKGLFELHRAILIVVFDPEAPRLLVQAVLDEVVDDLDTLQGEDPEPHVLQVLDRALLLDDVPVAHPLLPVYCQDEIHDFIFDKEHVRTLSQVSESLK